MQYIESIYLIPALHDAGLDALVESVVLNCRTEEQVMYSLEGQVPRSMTWELLKCYIADRKAAGGLTTITAVDEIGASALPAATARPAAPSDLGCSGGNVWFGTPSPATGSWQFLVNGVPKLVLQDYYITSLESLGAVSGDVVQICQIEEGVAGWFARITVP